MASRKGGQFIRHCNGALTQQMLSPLRSGFGTQGCVSTGGTAAAAVVKDKAGVDDGGNMDEADNGREVESWSKVGVGVEFESKEVESVIADAGFSSDAGATFFFCTRCFFVTASALSWSRTSAM